MMLRESIVRHPRRSRFVALRPHYVEMCDGNVCAAMLLAVFEGWKNWQRQGSEYPQPIHPAYGEDHSDPSLRLSMKELQRDLCDGWGKDAIKTGLAVLIDKGFIAEAEAVTSSDRAKRWYLNVVGIQEAVDAIGGNPQMESGRPQMQERKSATLTRAGETAVKNERKEPTD